MAVAYHRRAHSSTGKPVVSCKVFMKSRGGGGRDIEARDACKAIIAIGQPAIQPLTEALKGEDYVEQERATTVLAAIAATTGKESVIETLVETLERKDFRHHRLLEEELVKLGEPSVKPLVAALHNPDTDFRERVAEMLCQIGWEPTNDTDKAYYLVATGEVEFAAMLGPVTMDPLRLLICGEYSYHSTHIGPAKRAATVLGWVGGENATAILVEALKSSQDRVEYAAEDALVEIGLDASPALVSMLRDKNKEYRKRAAYALMEMEWEADNDLDEAYFLVADGKCDKAADELGAIAVEPLILANDGTSYAPDALHTIGSPAVGPLILALEDEDDRRRCAAARTLGHIGDNRAVVPLIKSLQDENPEVRGAAVYALDRFADPLVRSAEAWDEQTRVQAISSLEWFKELAIGPLTKALDDPSWEIRERALMTLVELDATPPLETLLKLLKDESNSIRSSIIAMLGTLGDKRAVEPLWEVVRNDDECAVQAAHSLAELGDKRSIDKLISALDSEYPSVRLMGVKGLALLGDNRALEPLIKATEDKESSYVSAAAATALGTFGDKRAVDPLIRATENEEDPGLRAAAATALGTLGDKRAVEPLITLLSDEDIFARSSAIEALGMLGDKRAIEPLKEFLTDHVRSHRHAADKALKMIRNSSKKATD